MAVDIPVRVIIDAIDNASKSFKTVADNAGNLTDSWKTLGVAGAALGVGVGLLAKDFIAQAGAMEQNQIAFETMLGSASKAIDLMNQIKGFAKLTPFNLSELVEGSKKLLAYNVEAKDLIPTLDMLGNISAGVGREKLPQLILAFGQVKAVTRLTGMELRQFSEAGVPLLDTLAKQFGKTTKEVQDMVSEGTVGFKDVEKALQTLTGEGGKFHELMQKQSKSTLGKVSNLQDAWQQMSATIGKSLLPTVNTLLETVIPMIENFGKWADKNQDLIKNISLVVAAFAGLAGVILPIMGAIKVMTATWAVLSAGFSAFTTIGGAVLGVLGAIAAAIGAPILIAVAAVTAAVVGLALAWKNNWLDIRGKTEAAKNWITGAIDAMVTWIKQIPDRLTEMATAAGVAWESFTTAIGNAITATIAAVLTKLGEMANAIVSFFTALPGQIASGVAAMGAAILKFFLEDVPYAWGYAAGVIVKFVTETIPAAFTALVAWLTDLVTVQLPAIGVAIGNFFTVTIPAAIDSWIAYLQTAIPAAADQTKATMVDMGRSIWATIVKMKDDTIAAINTWVSNAIAAVTNMKTQAIAQAQALYTNVKNWITTLIADTTALLQALPGIVSAQFEAAKQTAIAKAKEIYEGVKGWIDKVIQLFNDIVGAAQNAINKAREAATAGFNVGKRQFGGPVSGASSYIVGEAGQEQFTPQTAGYITPHGKYESKGSGSGGPTIQFIINADLIVNSPTERRNLAEAIYGDLVTLARSQNMTVAEMMGG